MSYETDPCDVATVALLPTGLDRLRAEVSDLRADLEDLRSIVTQLIVQFGEDRRSTKGHLETICTTISDVSRSQTERFGETVGIISKVIRELTACGFLTASDQSDKVAADVTRSEADPADPDVAIVEALLPIVRVGYQAWRTIGDRCKFNVDSDERVATLHSAVALAGMIRSASTRYLPRTSSEVAEVA